MKHGRVQGQAHTRCARLRGSRRRPGEAGRKGPGRRRRCFRIAVDDLGFAEAELGLDATAQLSEALVDVRRHLSDAFRLNRLNHEAIPGSREEVRARYLRIA